MCLKTHNRSFQSKKIQMLQSLKKSQEDLIGILNYNAMTFRYVCNTTQQTLQQYIYPFFIFPRLGLWQSLCESSLKEEDEVRECKWTVFTGCQLEDSCLCFWSVEEVESSYLWNLESVSKVTTMCRCNDSDMIPWMCHFLGLIDLV